ncbi:MAG: cytochrome b [Oceanicoccus sp.]|jgi:cytochrome b
MKKILVWDLHSRVFHWLLLLVVTFSLTTGLLADIDLMEWHMYSGYAVLYLLFFRLLTSIFSRDYGHIKHFHFSPRAIKQYLAGQRKFTGHNPLGSWMILVMVLALLLQAFTGLLTTDEIFVEGPWVAWAEESWISIASSIHAVSFRLILLLVVMHIAAVAYYQWVKRKNLVGPMVTGYKQGEDAQGGSVLPLPMLLLLMVISGLLCWYLVQL